MALKISPTLQLKHLRALAFQCGISTGGTKTTLTNRLLAEIAPILHYGPQSQPARILSIDMGIRNLAYCIIDLPSKTDVDPAKKAQLPSISAWRRLAVSFAPATNILTAAPLQKEAFDPPTMSLAAYNLLRNTLLPHNPTHVLIERQRFRSMGSPHILEWTIRVNMFESMLYAVLQTLRSEKVWDGIVIPIAPGKVGPFWIDPNPGSVEELEQTAKVMVENREAEKLRKKKTRNTKTAKLLNKGAKIDLVKTWLEEEEMVRMKTPEVEATAKAYLQKWHRLPGRKMMKAVAGTKVGEPEGVGEIGKLDDLADSLLQGMAWVKWEENKMRVLNDGVDSLELG